MLENSPLHDLQHQAGLWGRRFRSRANSAIRELPPRVGSGREPTCQSQSRIPLSTIDVDDGNTAGFPIKRLGGNPKGFSESLTTSFDLCVTSRRPKRLRAATQGVARRPRYSAPTTLSNDSPCLIRSSWAYTDEYPTRLAHEATSAFASA